MGFTGVESLGFGARASGSGAGNEMPGFWESLWGGGGGNSDLALGVLALEPGGRCGLFIPFLDWFRVQGLGFRGLGV